MKHYDVFKSQGGYAVALGIYGGCPVVGSCKWFETEAEAVQYAENHKAYCKAYDEWEEKIKYVSFEKAGKLKAPREKDFNLVVGIKI